MAAAVRLATQGHAVEIFEKRDKPGGRAYVYEKNGFKFDGGPTIITAPFMLDAIFTAAGRRREDYFKLVPCNPFYRIFDHKGRHFDYNGDEAFTLDQIERWSPADKAGYKQFIASTKAIFQKGFVELAEKPFLNFSDMLRVAPDLVRLQSYRNVHAYVSKYVKHDFLRQCDERLLARQALGVGHRRLAGAPTFINLNRLYRKGQANQAQQLLPARRLRSQQQILLAGRRHVKDFSMPNAD